MCIFNYSVKISDQEQTFFSSVNLKTFYKCIVFMELSTNSHSINYFL